MKSISLLGNGWLGRELHESFLSQSFDVKVSSRSTHTTFKVDIDKLDEDISSFLNSKILIINIPSKNIKGFKNLIEKIECSPVQKVLFVSSTSVCRDPNSSNPRYIIEEIFRNSTAFETTILRFSGLVGGSRNPANFVQNKLVLKDANAKVNLIHLDDCIGIINAILSKSLWGEILNASADTHPTKEEFYSYVCKESQVSVPSFETKKELIPFLVDNKELKKKLSYSFIHSDLMQVKFTF